MHKSRHMAMDRVPLRNIQHRPRGLLQWIRGATEGPLLYDILTIICSLLTIGCWFSLYRWYSLAEHFAARAFAFDRVPGHLNSTTLRYTVLLFATLTLVYVVNYWLISRTPSISSRIKLAAIVTIVGSGVVNILMFPVAAIDVFYYLSELKLTYFYHQNPYLVTFVPSFAADPFARFAWPLNVPLAYGPAWLLISRPVTTVVGFDDLYKLVLAYKAFSFLFLMLGGLIIFMYHDDEKRRWLGAFAFLANPFILFEAVTNAHNDIIMIAFLLAALLALKRDSSLAGPFLTLACLVKVFAVVFIPLFAVAMVMRKWSAAKILLSALLATVAVLVVVQPFWAHGKMLGGMVRGMNFANSLNTASPLSFARVYLQQHHASAHAFSIVRLVFGALFVLSAPAITWKLGKFERAIAYVLLLLYVLVGSIQPWYWISVIGLLSLKLDWVGFSFLSFASGVGLLIYMLDIWARFHSGLSFAHQLFLATLVLNLPIIGFLGLDLWYSHATRKRHASLDSIRPFAGRGRFAGEG